MQVLDNKDAASSITLGAAKKSTEFKMVADPSMLLTLSINLYTNPKLAVAREVLCNAWDAHIEAGRTDKPFRITITADNDFIIQDFGNGMPHDDLEEIYGTYGASTKVEDENTTGGFGLGCKSPFAVADSFRVTNERDGIKTVWQMVKSDVNKDGKPSITEVVRTTSENTGLTVSMRIPANIVEEMKTYIKYVVMHGEMNAEVKYGMLDEFHKLPVLGMSQEPGSFMLSSDWYHSYMGNHRIFIRYGAVLYPMLDNPSTEKQIALLKEFMGIVGYKYLVVQAAPNTLSLAPSREGLSSVNKTINGLTDICVNLVRNMEQQIIDQIPVSVKNLRKKLEGTKFFDNLNQTYHKITSKPATLYGHLEPEHIVRYLQSALGRHLKADVERKLAISATEGFKKSIQLKNISATKALLKISKAFHNRQSHNVEGFVKKYIFKPMTRRFIDTDLVTMHRLRLFCGRRGWAVDKYTKNFMRVLIEEMFWDFNSTKAMVDSPVVFLTSTTKAVEDSAKLYFKSNSTPFWVYHLKPKDDIAAVTKHFEAGNYKVVDLTQNHAWDLVAQERLKQKRAKATIPSTKTTKPVKPANRLIAFNSALVKGRHGIWTLSFDESVIQDIESPTWFVETSDLRHKGKLTRFAYIQDIPKEILENTVVVRKAKPMSKIETVAEDFMFTNNPEQRLKAAHELLAMKKKAKKGWAKLGLEYEGKLVEDLVKTSPKPVTKAKVVTEITAPPVVKKSRAETAKAMFQEFWEERSNIKAQQLALELIDFKRKAKVGWDKLGITPDQVKHLEGFM
ncbi:rIIA-like protein [Erwinia phage MIF8]